MIPWAESDHLGAGSRVKSQPKMLIRILRLGVIDVLALRIPKTTMIFSHGGLKLSIGIQRRFLLTGVNF